MLRLSVEEFRATSDLHFKHKNILKYTKRYSRWQTPEEMDEALIKLWNEKVEPESTVIMCGDFAFASKGYIRKVISQLNGKIILVKGNHDNDHHSDCPYDAFHSVHDYLEFYVGDQAFVAMHYPIESWNRMHHGSWHIHGHCHGSLTPNNNLLRMDVGIDCHPNYQPFNYSEIADEMGRRIFKAVDHHR